MSPFQTFFGAVFVAKRPIYGVCRSKRVNKDGYDDIIIGAYGKNSNQGAAYVIYGGPKSSMLNIDLSTTTLNPLTTGFMITGSALGDKLGYSVGSAGDINKDGYDDIIIGAINAVSNKGQVYVIYGGAKSSMSNIDLRSIALDPATNGFTVTGITASASFGSSVSGAGDINKDGYDDIIIGAYMTASGKGAVYVIYGGEKSSLPNIILSSTTLDPTTNGFTITGKSASGWFGFSVSSAGDINKDGFSDIIVGAYATGSGGTAYIIYGGEKTSFTISGNAGSYFGYAVSDAGDVNNDGYADVVVGAHQTNTQAGAAYVIYGGEKSSFSDIDLSTTTLESVHKGFTITPNVTGGTFGKSVSAADINNDGFTDILIAAPNENSGRGAVYALVYNWCTDHCGTCKFQSICQACENGYWLQANKCWACIPNCDTCPDSLTCQVCSEGYSLLGVGCESSCPVGMYSLNRVCEDCPSTCSQCTSATVCQECDNPYVKSNSQCLVSCPSKTYLSSGECFDCPATCSKCKSDSVCQECITGYTLSDSKLCIKSQPTKEPEEDKGTKASAAVFEGTSIVGSSLSSGSSLPLNFGLVAKILRNIKYLNMTVSSELTKTFYSWKTASGFMSAPKSWSSISESKALPAVFGRYGLDPVFLINFWKPFVMSLIGLGIFGVFKGIEVHLKKNSQTKGIAYKISRQIHLAASNFALTQFYCNIDDVVMYFIFEVRTTEFDCIFRVLSGLLAIILLTVGGIFVGLHSAILKKYQSVKREKTQLEAFMTKLENIKLIFKDYKDGSLFMQSFLLLNICRSLLSSIIFATLFEYPILQIVLLLILNVGMIVFIIAKKSFKEILSLCGQLFCEIVLLIAFICVFILAMFDHADSHPAGDVERLSKCIIVLNYILLVGCAIILVASIAKTFYENRQKKTNNLNKSEAIDMKNNILGSSKFSRPSSMPSLQSLGGHSTSTAGTGFRNNEYQNNSRINRNNYQSYGAHHPNDTSNEMLQRSYLDGSFETFQANLSQDPSQTEVFGETSQLNLFPKSSFYQNQHQRMRMRAPPQGNGVELNSNFNQLEVTNMENNFAPMMGPVASSGLTADPQYLLRKRKIRKNEDLIYGRMRK